MRPHPEFVHEKDRGSVDVQLTDVGLHMNFVSWLVILGAFKTCSTLHPS